MGGSKDSVGGSSTFGGSVSVRIQVNEDGDSDEVEENGADEVKA